MLWSFAVRILGLELLGVEVVTAQPGTLEGIAATDPGEDVGVQLSWSAADC